MTTMVRKWGNSMAVRLPRAVVQAVELEEGTPVAIEEKGGRVLLTPMRKLSFSLGSLVRRINAKNRHGSIETEAPRGRETW